MFHFCKNLPVVFGIQPAALLTCVTEEKKFVPARKNKCALG